MTDGAFVLNSLENVEGARKRSAQAAGPLGICRGATPATAGGLPPQIERHAPWRKSRGWLEFLNVAL